jgi:3,4-dihydroxy 2-butanone 4-phosphate synthase/GTP cyclohydrolase II
MLDTWLDETTALMRRETHSLVTLSYAQSLDGSIAMVRGAPLTLSCMESTKMTHHLRASHDAIIVGIGTVESDNPLLTVRHARGESPIPVILDSHLRTSVDARIFLHPKKPVIACLVDEENSSRAKALSRAGATILPIKVDEDGRISLPDLLNALHQRGIKSVMVEGGAGVISAFLRQGLVDRAVLTVTPVFVGGLKALENTLCTPGNQLVILKDAMVESVGNDFVIFGKLDR